VTRREFLGLGLLLGCSEEEICMDKKKKLLIYNALMGGASADTRLSMTGVTTYKNYGDSIGFGLNATAGDSYRELLTSFYTWAISNEASSGRGVWFENFQFILDSFTKLTTIIIKEGGVNDRRRGAGSTTLNKIQSCNRTMIMSAFKAAQVASGSAGVVRVGVINPSNLQALAGVGGAGTIPGNVASTNNTTPSATWSYTFTAPQNGTIAYVLFNATYPGGTRGDCTVHVDGVLTETITDFKQRYDNLDDGGNNNQFGPDTRFYFGLAAGSHTILVTATSSTVVIDQFGYLEPPANCGPFLLLEIPKIVDYAFVGASGAALDKASDATIDQCNVVNQAIVEQFRALGYPIRWVPIMSTTTYLGITGDYNLTGGIDTDNIHPNNTGHGQIFSSIQKHLKP
jgi:hypothetical protein